jgi:hypothetical protein
MADEFAKRFFPQFDGKQLPAPHIGFAPEDIRTLAWYKLGYNSHGLKDEIIFNTQNLQQPGESDNDFKWRICATLLHEMVHLWQQNYGEHPYVRGRNTHNKEFVNYCEKLGLHPRPVTGQHWKIEDGVFAMFMHEIGLHEPSYEMVPKGEKRYYWQAEKPKGRSTLSLIECPECGRKLRDTRQTIDEVAACIPCTRRIYGNVPMVAFRKEAEA